MLLLVAKILQILNDVYHNLVELGTDLPLSHPLFEFRLDVILWEFAYNFLNFCWLFLLFWLHNDSTFFLDSCPMYFTSKAKFIVLRKQIALH